MRLARRPPGLWSPLWSLVVAEPTRMDTLLDFVDRLCLAERLYGRVPRADGGGRAEVSWERAAKPHAWRVRADDHEEWKTVAADGLVAELERLGLDLASFER